MVEKDKKPDKVHVTPQILVLFFVFLSVICLVLTIKFGQPVSRETKTSFTAQWAHLEKNLWLTQSEEEKRKKSNKRETKKFWGEGEERDVSTKQPVNVTPYTRQYETARVPHQRAVR